MQIYKFHANLQITNVEYAEVAKLADAHGLGPCPARGAGSTPALGTKELSTIGVES